MKLVVLYGPPAAGKYTIAKAIAENLGYKLFHNHLTVDLLKNVFEFGSPGFFELSQTIRLLIFERATQQNVTGIVFTFVYEKDVDDNFVRKLIKTVTSNGGEIVFIQIDCEKDELLKRVTDESRKAFKKVRSQEGLLATLNTRNITSAIDFVDSYRIENTNLSVQDTVEKALEIIKAD
ncbi:MAG: AAA family ATPase [Anaerolineae bacterium]|nr:AAA family ATPase [Anaerolineae bacterium]